MMRTRDIVDDILGEPKERGVMGADPNLVKLVATRQSGDPKKGLRELIQNAEDTMGARRRITGEKPGPIDIDVSQPVVRGAGGGFRSELTFTDSGLGFASVDDFYEKMSTMGGQWKGVDDRGEFGIGKGQAIGMVYNPNMDDYDGTVAVTTMIKGEPWRIDGFKIEKGLITFNKPYKVRGFKKKGDAKWGTEWKIVSNKATTFDYENIKEYLEENVKGISLKLNGSNVLQLVAGKKVEIPGAVVYFHEGADGFTVYNRGIRIREESVQKGWGGDILTTINLKTDMSRMEIMDEDTNWETMKERITQEVIRQVDKRLRFSDEEKKGILHLLWMEEDTDMYERWKNKRVVTLADGKVVSIRQFLDRAKKAGGFFWGEDSLINGDLIDQGLPIVPEYLRTMLSRVFDQYEPVEAKWNSWSDVVESKFYLEKKGKAFREIEKAKWTDEEVIASRLMEEIIESSGMPARKVLWGKGPARAWTNGKDSITLNKDIFDATVGRIKEGVAAQTSVMLKLLPTVIHEMAHDTDNRIGSEKHGTEEFYESYAATVEVLSKAAATLFKEGKSYSPLYGTWLAINQEKALMSQAAAMKRLREEVCV